MAVRKLKGSWWVDFQHRGVRTRRRSPVNTRSGAVAYEVELRQRVLAPAPRPEESSSKTACPEPEITFAQYAEEWLATYVRTNNRASEQRTKSIIVRQHLAPAIGRRALSQVSRREIENYKASKLREGLSPKTINNHLMVLSRCLRTAQEDELLATLPLIKLLSAPPPDFDFLLPIESYQLLQDGREPLWSELARLALRTGMRRGELMALDWSDIDLDRARLSVRRSFVDGSTETPKNNRVRHLPLTRDVVEMLSRRTRRSGLVFRREDGRPLAKSVMGGGLLRLCRRTGTRPIGWHVLRHTFASQLAMAGVPLIVIRDLLGHASIQMTMRYAHLAPSTLAQAVPVLLEAEAKAVATECQPGVNRSPFALREPLLVPAP